MDHFQDFPNWESFVHYVETTHRAMGSAHDSESGGYSFTHTHSFGEAISLAKNGWFEGLNLIDKRLSLLDNLLPIPVEKDEYYTYDVVGPGIVDRNIYFQGRPDFMKVRREIEQEAIGFVHIMFNGLASAGVSPETLITKGGLVCKLTELLEKHNRRVKITLCFGNRGGWSTPHTVQNKILIKDYNELVSREKLVMALGHPSTLRRLWFKYLETIRVIGPYLTNSGYGRCDDPKEWQTPDIVYIGSNDGYKMSMDNKTQLAWIKEQLARFGIEIINV